MGDKINFTNMLRLKMYPFRQKPVKPSVPYEEYLANRVDKDQTPQNAASDQDLNCLHEV